MTLPAAPVDVLVRVPGQVVHVLQQINALGARQTDKHLGSLHDERDQ